MAQKKQARPRPSETVRKDLGKKQAEYQLLKERISELNAELKEAEQYEEAQRQEKATRAFEKAMAQAGIVWDEATALKAAELLAAEQSRD